MGKIWPKNRSQKSDAHRSQAVLRKNVEFDVGSGGVCGELENADIQYLIETDTIQLGGFFLCERIYGLVLSDLSFSP